MLRIKINCLYSRDLSVLLEAMLELVRRPSPSTREEVSVDLEVSAEALREPQLTRKPSLRIPVSALVHQAHLLEHQPKPLILLPKYIRYSHVIPNFLV